MKLILAATMALAASTSPAPRSEKIVLRVLGTDPGAKNVVWIEPAVAPVFAMRVIEGSVPEKGAIQCVEEEQGVVRELDGVKGQFTLVKCEGGVEMGVARVEFGGR
jgi:hypothetical protein